MDQRASSKKSGRSESDTVLYEAGSFVCFVNGADDGDDERWDKFCIGMVSRVYIARY